MDKTILLGAGVALTGAIVRAMKTDTLNAALETRGLPVIPKRALPWLAVLVGFAYAVLTELDARGFDAWQEAVLIGSLEGLGVGGAAMAIHDLGKGVPGVGRALAIPAIIAATMSISACDPRALSVIDLVADKIRCGIANQNLPDEEIIKRCALTPEDIPRVLDIVGMSRTEAADEAAGAANRQAVQDRQSGVCR